MLPEEQYIALRDALEGMVWQFAYDGVIDDKPVLRTGGLSALEDAFAVLGMSDPYYLSEEETRDECCEIQFCNERATAGWHWGKYYLRVCGEHRRTISNWNRENPNADESWIKPHALEREANRGPDGCLS